MNDVADVLTDGGVDTGIVAAASSAPAPFPGEVAAAAADSFFPVAALQHLIDAVHSFTGLNWLGFMLVFVGFNFVTGLFFLSNFLFVNRYRSICVHQVGINCLDHCVNSRGYFPSIDKPAEGYHETKCEFLFHQILFART